MKYIKELFLVTGDLFSLFAKPLCIFLGGALFGAAIVMYMTLVSIETNQEGVLKSTELLQLNIDGMTYQVNRLEKPMDDYFNQAITSGSIMGRVIWIGKDEICQYNKAFGSDL